jgi:hypothetical protein
VSPPLLLLPTLSPPPPLPLPLPLPLLLPLPLSQLLPLLMPRQPFRAQTFCAQAQTDQAPNLKLPRCRCRCVANPIFVIREIKWGRSEDPSLAV